MDFKIFIRRNNNFVTEIKTVRFLTLSQPFISKSNLIHYLLGHAARPNFRIKKRKTEENWLCVFSSVILVDNDEKLKSFVIVDCIRFIIHVDFVLECLLFCLPSACL